MDHQGYKYDESSADGLEYVWVTHSIMAATGSAISGAVFFEEGSGYFLVRIIDEGYTSLTALVRSSTTGELYIRKQGRERTPDDVSSMIVPDSDTAYGRLVSRIPSAAKLIGYTEYQYGDADRWFTASYWEYYSGESLSKYLQRFVETATPPPEHFVWYMFSTMLRSVLSCHQRGLAHCDGHSGNWFVRFNPSSHPDLLLGDFGNGITRTDVEQDIFQFYFLEFDEVWMSHCRSDLDHLALLLKSVLYNCDEQEMRRGNTWNEENQGGQITYSLELSTCIATLEAFAQEKPETDFHTWHQEISMLHQKVEHTYQQMMTEIGDSHWTLEPGLVRTENHHMTVDEFLGREIQSTSFGVDELLVFSVAQIDLEGKITSINRMISSPDVNGLTWEKTQEEAVLPEY